MKISEIMETDVVSIKKDTRYEDVAKILYEKNICGDFSIKRNGRFNLC